MARRIVHDAEEARRIRETFQDAPVARRRQLQWDWPKRLVEAGECCAVMYTSDKWQRDGSFQDYKHVAEGPQLVFLKEHFLTDGATGRPMPLEGRTVNIGRGPDTIAFLAYVLGLQVRLYARDEDGELYLPPEGNLFQIDIPRAELGAGVHPSTGETFLCIWSGRSVLAVITGSELDVTADGIVG